MRLHLLRARDRPTTPPRPAKLIQLEARREARTPKEHLTSLPQRPVL